MYQKFLIASVLALCLLAGARAKAQTAQKEANEGTGTPVGKKVDDFTAIDQDENTYTLYDQLQDGPVVLLFYRGQWCPVCNRHLSNLQDSLQLIYDKGQAWWPSPRKSRNS